MTKLDISGGRFNDLDFSEAYIFFPCPRTLSHKIKFEAWGITLLTSSIWGKTAIKRLPVKFDSTAHDIYISGYSEIEIGGVVGGNIQVSLYEPGSIPESFCQTKEGSEWVLFYSWPGDIMNKQIEAYQLSGVLSWPYGDCTITLYASGPNSIKFSIEDCIKAAEFVSSPHQYGYQRPHGLLPK